MSYLITRPPIYVNPYADGPRYVTEEWLEWRAQFADWDARFSAWLRGGCHAS
jgi:hypothetical protein